MARASGEDEGISSQKKKGKKEGESSDINRNFNLAL